MAKIRFKSLVLDKVKNPASAPLLALVELVPLPGHKLDNIRAFLKAYAARKNEIPASFRLAGITLPQSPGGVASMSPLDIYSILAAEGLWNDLDVICHLTAKDHNLDAIKTTLAGMRQMGLDSCLALTGDKPVSSKGVFEVDSLGLIRLMHQMNHASIQAASPGKFDQAHQFFAAAAVSPYKYTEASQMQQYLKMAKKVRWGADCLFTQLGWDWRKAQELFWYLRDASLSVPVIGNVYALTTQTPAPRLMHEGKLPGCVVTSEFFARLQEETPQQQLQRAAVQAAMFRQMGAVGIDLGGVTSFDMMLDILRQAETLGANWQNHRGLLDYGVKGGFYLYDDNGKRQEPHKTKAPLSKRSFDLFHGMLFTPGKGLNPLLSRLARSNKGFCQGKGGLYNCFFNALETPVKHMLFKCQGCGDCYLTENFGVCSLGNCAKGLPNVPCGDANPDGTCGNNPAIPCVGERVWQAAASEGARGLEHLGQSINFRRDPALLGTASMINNWLGRDHTRHRPLIQIGESVHASIPKCGAAMKELAALGPAAYQQPSGALNYIISLIASQAEGGADYIAINLDAFAEDDIRLAVTMMRQYVRLVVQHGQQVPVCIDSSNDDVLRAGLEEWYVAAGKQAAKPLLNSVKVFTAEKVLPWAKNYPFKFIGLLVDDKDPEGNTRENLYQMACTIFDAAQRHGFANDDIFFDSTVFPLAIDMPMMPGKPGYTCTAFETIRMIRNTPRMKGVHCSLGISNCVRDLPGRKVGVCRAYVAKAMEYGLDAGIVNITHEYGTVTPAPELMEMVDAFAHQDGSPERTEVAITKMGDFCRSTRLG